MTTTVHPDEDPMGQAASLGLPVVVLPADILASTAARYGVTVADLAGRGATTFLMRARREAVCRLHEEVGLSFTEIGRLLGGRDRGGIRRLARTP